MSRPEGGLPRELAEARFRRLYDEHGREVLAYALRRTSDPEDAADVVAETFDVVAETFLVAWRRGAEVPPGPAARLWRVEVNTWLEAMPPEVVQPDALDATVERMLNGVPLPPDFDPSALHDPSPITDRYRLGTAVTGAVACGWLEEWVAAARDRDLTRACAAARGLGSARNWPVLLSMVREKGWRGDRLPPHGNGWASIILGLAKEIETISRGSGRRWCLGSRSGRS